MMVWGARIFVVSRRALQTYKILTSCAYSLVYYDYNVMSNRYIVTIIIKQIIVITLKYRFWNEFVDFVSIATHNNWLR